MFKHLSFKDTCEIIYTRSQLLHDLVKSLFRAKSRRGVTVSYKEDSEGKTDSEDLVDVDYTEPDPAVVDNSESIEKVLAKRRGKKGVVGNITTVYAVEENGDPNANCDINDQENTELQYLIKWKGWSHIHNTWESEQSLKDQKVRTKKLTRVLVYESINV